MIDNKLEGRLREIQASMIKKTKCNVTFSHVVNKVLNEGLKNMQSNLK